MDTIIGFDSISVPIWGLFNLTNSHKKEVHNMNKVEISVPIWGLFNLTCVQKIFYLWRLVLVISVPIWGLFNLTPLLTSYKCIPLILKFPSPSGDYLI